MDSSLDFADVIIDALGSDKVRFVPPRNRKTSRGYLNVGRVMIVRGRTPDGAPLPELCVGISTGGIDEAVSIYRLDSNEALVKYKRVLNEKYHSHFKKEARAISDEILKGEVESLL